MKNLFYILLIFAIPSLAQNKTETVKISAFKSVTVELPPGFIINRIHPGLEEQFYTAKQIGDTFIALQATNNTEFPPSNVTVFCDSAIFYFDVEFQTHVDKYHYPLTIADAIKITSQQNNPTTRVNTPIKVETPMTDALTASDSGELTPDDTLYYTTDRLSLGQAFNGGDLLAYVSNLYGNDEFITVSLRITNNSNVVYHTDAIDFFITTKVKKKKTTSIADADDPTPYKQMNTFPTVVTPGDSGLYIMRFRKFSLDSNNNIKIVAGEGKGRRTISFEITSKMFNKYIMYY